MSLREPNAEPIPGYRLIEPLGSGGFGEVWKCEAPGRILKAMKFVYGNLNSLDDEGGRAEQELRALDRIKEVRHPFVLSLDRIEVVEGELVLVMELADKSLHDAYVECQAAGLVGIPRDVLLRYIRDASEALDHMLEKHNLLHLDIKPRNLFLISDRVKVADFGLVKQLERSTASGILGGVTPLYAPPETIQNKITPYSDQYSLAIVYQELLTGHRPFSGKNARQLALQHMHDEPELRFLPEAERPVVARALSKDPTKRWPNCVAFVRALYTARNPTRGDIALPTNDDIGWDQTSGDVHIPSEGATPTTTPTLPPLPPAKPRAPDEVEVEVSNLGITVAKPDTGALRPTLLVGIGSFGRRALLELRCRFLDRFGDLSKVPLIRFLYLDSDAEEVRSATRGAPEVALANGAVYHLPLQQVGNYRRRSLDQLNEWLPREKLYAMPRSLQTQGSRALGRLAFADNHHRLLARLRYELKTAAHPDTLYQSVSRTGLALRESEPRVYVIAAAGGGSSGLLVDLGYGLRRVLKQLRHADAEVIALLHCGAPCDPATPKTEQANVYACLTEMNHYAEPGVPFGAQYGADDKRIAEEGRPYESVYLLQTPNRTPEGLRDVVAHLGSYVFHDVTTPLGVRLDRSRHTRNEGTTPFRSFGTYGVWFPRGLLLWLAARQVSARLLEEWQTPGPADDPQAVETACAAALQDEELQFEALCARIEEAASQAAEGTPAEALQRLLTFLEDQAQEPEAQNAPGEWAGKTVERLREWTGNRLTAEPDSTWRQSRLGRALAGAVQQVVKQWDDKLSKVAFALMDQRGHRLAAAEAGFRSLARFCQESSSAAVQRLDEQARHAEQAWGNLEAALQACQGASSGFSLFGGRRRQLRTFVEYLAQYAQQRLLEVVLSAGMQFFIQLNGRFEERIREVSFLRQRLRHAQEHLEAAPEDTDGPGKGSQPVEPATAGTTPVPSPETYWEGIRESKTVRVVLPDAETDLGRAADRFVRQLTPENWRHLDEAMQERLLGPRGGLHPICVGSGDLVRRLANPLAEHAATALGEILPLTDVAQVEFTVAAAEESDISSRAMTHYAEAAPLVEEKDGEGQQAFLLLPASEAGKTLAEQAKQVLPMLQLVRVPGQADLMFCREQSNITVEDLRRLLLPCRPAYQEAAALPLTSPHARFDVSDWVPIDPGQ